VRFVYLKQSKIDIKNEETMSERGSMKKSGKSLETAKNSSFNQNIVEAYH
jgi:hypothetical protein